MYSRFPRFSIPNKLKNILFLMTQYKSMSNSILQNGYLLSALINIGFQVNRFGISSIRLFIIVGQDALLLDSIIATIGKMRSIL